MDPSDGEVDGDDEAKEASAKTARASKKRGRHADGNDEESKEEDAKENKQQLKRKRLKGPEPVKKDAENDDDSGANGDAKASAAEDEEMEEKDDSEDKKAKTQENGNAVAETPKKPAAKKTPAKKKTPARKARVSAKKTPAKAAQSDEEDDDDLPVPPQGLATNATPVAAKTAAAASTKKSAKKNHKQAKIVVNGSASPTETPESETQQEEAEEPAANSDVFTKKMFWFFFFFVLQLSCSYLFDVHSKVMEASNFLLPFYKNIWFTMNPPIEEKRNQTFLDEVNSKNEQRENEIRDKLKKLKDLQTSLQAEIRAIEKEATDFKDDKDGFQRSIEDHKEPAEKLRSRLLRIDSLLQGKTRGDIKQAMSSLGYIKQALGENDEDKLLDLSKLDVWEIAEIPEGCNDGEFEEIGEDSEDSVSADSGDYNEGSTVVDPDALEEWMQEIQELIKTSTDEILKDDGVSKQVRTWVRSEIKKDVNWDKTLAKYTVEEVSKLIKKEITSKGSSTGGSINSNAIVKQIQERLELEIADQTGRYDFASIRNGAAVIGEGPRATSHSLVQDLPVFNRLMAHTGLRFYGHGAEAALIPTDPPSALGQCWSFQSEGELMKKRKKSAAAQDFSRGSVATLAVRLARPAYVHSVVIEHPPKEITDRIQSAIRAFRIVGYEDDVATKGSYELGRFEYKIGKYTLFIACVFFQSSIFDVNLCICLSPNSRRRESKDGVLSGTKNESTKCPKAQVDCAGH